MKIKRSKIKRMGETLIGIGFFGVIFGGMTFDGPDYMFGMLLILLSALIMSIGNKFCEISTRQNNRHPTRVPDQARRDAVFQWWLEHGTLERR